ncbi:hypothetical protein E4U43_007006 [Claviceps pusilla]|uniref:RRM domain-containing protein n=1 Tax=Claviceps pusilla TaxID=123648 RepID=A0A9P7SZG2_9HYPO|nr:hypothetical protein E4U43_007006 [Claviceps pusilla]
MTANMDRGLDEIIADKPTDWLDSAAQLVDLDTQRALKMRRSTRDEPRHLDSIASDNTGSKLRVENIHYDLTEEDLDELFSRIGRVSKLSLRYDRAGRSEGTAYVTYERKQDAEEAIRQFDGANANGQPIRLKLLPSRNPFDTAVMPGRPLSERISNPGGRARSTSPRRRMTDEDASRRGIDRYVPGERSRSPAPRRRGGREEGRRPGARREGHAQDSARGGARSNPRVKKTQEELDAEMADYFGNSSNDAAPTVQSAPNGAAPAAGADDIDMIE